MEIHKKINEIMKKVGHIEKGRQGALNYKFRGIDDVMAALQPLLVEFGVYFCPKLLSERHEERQSKSGGFLIYSFLTVEYEFYALDGSSIKVSTIGEAMDSSDKSSNKAMSAALKYALVQLFCIPTEGDNDTENSDPDPKPYSKDLQEKPSDDNFKNYKPDPEKLVSQPQVKRLYAIKAKAGMDDDPFKAIVMSYGYDSTSKIKMSDYEKICNHVQGK